MARHRSTTTILITIITILSACDNGKVNSKKLNKIFSKREYDLATVNKFTQQYLAALQLDTLGHAQQIKNLYQLNNNTCLWIDEQGLNEQGKACLAALATLPEHGFTPQTFESVQADSLIKLLNTKQYNGLDKNDMAAQCDMAISKYCCQGVKALMHGVYNPKQFHKDNFTKPDSAITPEQVIYTCIQKDSLSKLLQYAEPKLALYLSLKQKLKEFTTTLNNPWPQVSELKDSLANGFIHPQVAALRTRIYSEFGIPKDTTNTAVDDAVINAIKVFQYYHDVKPTGKLDTGTVRRLNQSKGDKIAQIKTNMERIRWGNNNYATPYVLVNIPKMDLNYIGNKGSEFNMKVVVGRASRPTPTLDARMTDIVINPGWSVPETIMKEEIIPGINKRGNKYLARRGLRAFYRGKQVDPSRITAKNFKMYSIQQKPGLNSALGAVKFNLPNRHAIYLHDTPHREDFKKHYRAYSSGCIRVEKPRDFAAFLIKDSNYTSTKIDTMVRKRITKGVKLKENLDVHIVYYTNGLDSNGNLMYLRDIYKLDAELNKQW
jgi:L,D-transpeptidase YcbB